METSYCTKECFAGSDRSDALHGSNDVHMPALLLKAEFLEQSKCAFQENSAGDTDM